LEASFDYVTGMDGKNCFASERRGGHPKSWVEVYTYYSELIENKITLKGKVKVELEPHQGN